jgi:DNA-binding NarL/FixJ family response regulator
MANLLSLPAQQRIRVLVADSTAMSTQLLIDGLRRDQQFETIECPSNPGAALPLITREKPHVAVISARLGEKNTDGFDLARDVRLQLPSAKLVLLLDASERNLVIESFRSGAHGVFCRTEPFRQLARCIECVHAGQVWASSAELHFLLEALAKPALAGLPNVAGSLLSARETDVVRCLAEGLSNRQIAQRLNLTEHTVKNYLFRIFDKLGVSNRIEVVLYALGKTLGHEQVRAAGKRQLRSALNAAHKAPSRPMRIRKTAS